MIYRIEIAFQNAKYESAMNYLVSVHVPDSPQVPLKRLSLGLWLFTVGLAVS
jgi:hypothetical protein